MTRNLSLAEYLWLSAEVTGIPIETLAGTIRIGLADSALHAAAAGSDRGVLFPDVVGKAAVLCWRLARNHPLPDDNKRAA